MPSDKCPACQEERIHTDQERAAHHPLAGHGFADGQGWSTPGAEQAYVADQKEKEKANAAQG
jgi:hypothetical protein